MAKKVLAVYDPCQDYLERFLSFANAGKNSLLEIIGFTDLAILRDSLKNKRIEAALFSQEEENTDFRERSYAGLKDFLAEERTSLIVFILGERANAPHLKEDLKKDGIYRDYIWIDKYQSAENILGQIKTVLFPDEETQRQQKKEFGFSLSGLFAPQDKQSHPEAALALMQEKIRKKEKILYIATEQFAALKLEKSDSFSASLSNVLYYYRTDPKRLPEIISRQKGIFKEMDVLTAPENLDDLEELTEEEWPDFLLTAAGSGDYQHIILDMSFFSQKIFDVIFRYGNLYIPALPYPGGEESPRELTRQKMEEAKKEERAFLKLKEFRQYFLDRGREEELSKILLIRAET